MAEKPKSPAELEQMLKDMESMSKGIGETPKPVRSEGSSGGGALKSLLGFFVKIHDEDEETPKVQPPITPVSQLPPPSASNAPTSGKSLATTPLKPTSTTSSMGDAPAQRKVADLVANEPPPKFNQPTVSQENDLSKKPFEEIYREAGVLNSKASVDELVVLLNNPTIANHPLSVKVVAVNLALSTKEVKIDDYIADAVRKDRALDAYQLMLNERATSVEEKSKAGIEQIQKEVEEYLKRKQQEMEKLRAEAAEASKQAVEFAISRQVEEQRLADVISPFLEGKPNPVSIGNTPERSQTQE